MYPSIPITAAERGDLHTRARSQAHHLRRSAEAALWQGFHRLATRALHAGRDGVLRLAHNSRHPSGV